MHSPLEIAKNYIEIGIHKVRMPVIKMFVLAIYAGCFIAIAGIGATTAAVSVPSASLARLVSAMIFPAGLAMVLIAGSELFTGNNLIIIPVLEKKVKVWEMLVNWVVVYLGNFVGTVLVAYLVVKGHTPDLFDGALAESIVNAANIRTTMEFSDAFIRGILCNFLVCIAVWMSFAAKKISGKIMALYFPIMIFVLCGFEHSIADMYYVAAGLFAKAEYSIQAEGLTWFNFFFKNLLPVTLGNLVGGCVIVGMGYWYAFLKPFKAKNKELEESEIIHAEEY